MNYPKISIVTPSFNQGLFLEHTIKSIVEQGYPNLEYIIIDGGSSDNSVDIIKKYEQHLTYWVSEKDNGLYHALQKGFDKTTGEIMGWLNSDDMLYRKSLFTVAEIFINIPLINWFQGLPCLIDEIGRTVAIRTQRSNKFSFYMKDYHDGNFIQQESTYWRRKLWVASGGYISQEYKYAGDFELWMRFFRKDILYTTGALIGAFRLRKEGQLSINHQGSYFDEADRIVDQEIALHSLYGLLNRVKLYRKYIAGVPILNKLLADKLLAGYNIASSYDNNIYYDLAKQVFTK